MQAKSLSFYATSQAIYLIPYMPEYPADPSIDFLETSSNSLLWCKFIHLNIYDEASLDSDWTRQCEPMQMQMLLSIHYFCRIKEILNSTQMTMQSYIIWNPS